LALVGSQKIAMFAAVVTRWVAGRWRKRRARITSLRGAMTLTARHLQGSAAE